MVYPGECFMGTWVCVFCHCWVECSVLSVRSNWPVVFVEVSASLLSSLWLFLTCCLHAPSVCSVPFLFYTLWYFCIGHMLEFFCLYLFLFIHICMWVLFSGSTVYWKIVSMGSPWKPLLCWPGLNWEISSCPWFKGYVLCCAFQLPKENGFRTHLPPFRSISSPFVNSLLWVFFSLAGF